MLSDQEPIGRPRRLVPAGRTAAVAIIILLAALPLLGCGLCQTFTESASKLFGGGDSQETTTTEATGTDSTVETQLPPPEEAQESQLVILTQRRGNATRTAILETLRYHTGMGSERGSLFVVLWLAKKGRWAMFQGRTERNGTPVEAVLTYNAASGAWRVVGFAKGGWKQVVRADYPQAPAAIFSGARAWPAEVGSASGGFRNLTNKKSSSTRAAILDAIRANMGWTINGKKIVFTVRWLGEQDGWAYFVGEEYNVKLPLDCLLRKSGGTWRVIVTQGEGDFPQTIRQAHPEAPSAIFDGYQ